MIKSHLLPTSSGAAGLGLIVFDVLKGVASFFPRIKYNSFSQSNFYFWGLYYPFKKLK